MLFDTYREIIHIAQILINDYINVVMRITHRRIRTLSISRKSDIQFLTKKNLISFQMKIFNSNCNIIVYILIII